MKMKKAWLVEDKDLIEIWFDFDYDLLNAVREIPGREFKNNRRGKYWICPVSEDAVKILKNAGFRLDKKLVDRANKLSITIDEIEDLTIVDLKKKLYPFQVKGTSFIEAKEGRALIGDEMGLGKTIQALAWLHIHPELRPVVIVCPAHLKLNWKREIDQTLPGKQNIQIIFGTDHSQELTGDIIIINYDILPNSYERYRDSLNKKRYKEIPQTGWVDYLIKIKPKVLVIDEAHYIKNTSAFRTKGVRKLARKIPHVIGLTGTPIINRPIEGFNIVQIINKSIFPDFWKYVHRYCDAKHNGFGWDYSGASNKEELHNKLKGIMLRRKKVDVLPELPEKTHTYVPIELNNENEYLMAEEDFVRYVRKEKGSSAAGKAKKAEHLSKIEELKQLTIKGKMSQVIQWVEDYLENNGKLVLFTTHKFTVSELMKKFTKIAVKIDGSVSAADREIAVNEFQNNENVKLFVGNIQAAGTGLTLTAASSVAFIELPWTPGELVQAEDRCHRIGQKNAVNIYYLLAANTIEEKIAELLDKKREVLDEILDGKFIEEVPLLTELIKFYKEKE